MKDETPAILKLHHDGSFLSSPLAEELARVVNRLRAQWLPEEGEKTKELSGWRFIHAALGPAFFLYFFAAYTFDQRSPISDGQFASVAALVGPFDIARIASVLAGAVLFALLILFQRGKGGPVSVFLGGVAFPALAIWIAKSALS